MQFKTSHFLLLAMSCSTLAMADDSEIFTGAQKSPPTPNMLLILDTSGSMGTKVSTPAAYDPTHTYSGSCSTNQIYFQGSNGGTPTGCSGMSSFSSNYQKCRSASAPVSGSPGFYTDRFVQWQVSGSNYSWSTTLDGNSNHFEVACKGDFNLGTAPFPTIYNGTANSSANEWATDANSPQVYWNNGNGGGYTLYSGNYLNYQASSPPQVAGTRISVVQQAAVNLINSLSNVNVGLMRYSDNDGGSNDTSAAGGMVAYPVTAVATARSDLVSTINSYSPGGWTPLSETLYEAYLYYSGGNVNFGNHSAPFKSVAASRVGGTLGSGQYRTPITDKCQKNFIVYLTDGLPTQDNEADSLITDLAGDCDNTSGSPYNGLDSQGRAIPGGWGPSSRAGRCMAPLAKYMNNTDMFTGTDMPGQQNVQLYTIGFGNDPALGAAASWLGTAASNGGGKFYQASDPNGLQSVLTNIVNNILTTSSTFAAPAVSVNAFNRTQTLNDLYVSVFQPGPNYHWPGNVKKYTLKNGVIKGQNNTDAVDPKTGFFMDSAHSLWSAEADGSQVQLGGAASKLPSWDPAAQLPQSPRKLYTYIGGNNPAAAVDLTAAGNAVVTTNSAITNAVLGVNSSTAHDNVINYARGEDLKHENEGNGSTTETRHAMGDPIHSQASVLIYGGTTAAPDVNDAVVYSATNDGFLHAFDVTDGQELWAFIPQEKLSGLSELYSNSPTSPKHYGLDGNIRILKYDINGDGIIDPLAGDRAILYVGDGRGGSMYYAIDITAKVKPKFLWGIGAGTTGMAGIGLTWSTPTITRVKIKNAAQNTQFFALVFGGGYDTAEESTSYQTSDASGKAVYIVDALYGTVLWSAGSSTASPAPTLALSRMDHAIPSDVTVLDLDGDGYADRMYVGDMAGQVWRFDIYEGNTVDKLVTGGVIASLGTRDDNASPHPIAATRRFYNAPDIAGVAAKSGAYLNIAIGSGYRGHPLNTTIQDRFYALRDHDAFNKLTQSQYDSYPVIHDSDSLLIDITSSVQPVIPSGAVGWKLQLNQGVGEKVLSSSTTFENQILFITYQPGTSPSSDPCAPKLGTNRVYAVSIFDGSPVANLNNQNNLSITDRDEKLAQGGIAPGVTLLFPAPEPGAGTPPGPPGQPQKVTCSSGGEVLGVCKDFNSRFKTFWSEKDAN